MRATAVEAEGVRVRFGPTVALDGVDLTVRPGESHALVGRNGAGKSTLVSVLTGLNRPDSGTVRLDGEPAPPYGDTAAWRARVACVHPEVDGRARTRRRGEPVPGPLRGGRPRHPLVEAAAAGGRTPRRVRRRRRPGRTSR